MGLPETERGGIGGGMGAPESDSIGPPGASPAEGGGVLPTAGSAEAAAGGAEGGAGGGLA